MADALDGFAAVFGQCLYYETDGYGEAEDDCGDHHIIVGGGGVWCIHGIFIHKQIHLCLSKSGETFVAMAVCIKCLMMGW
jgi:hypothetical protein